MKQRKPQSAMAITTTESLQVTIKKCFFQLHKETMMKKIVSKPTQDIYFVSTYDLKSADNDEE